MKFSLLMTVMILVAPIWGLVCYDNSEGVTNEVSNPEWDYCMLIPQTEKSEARQFGITSQEDSVNFYETSFKASDNVYSVLTVCILEKYDMRTAHRRFAGQFPEFLFRCVCNYDRCNSHKTFAQYLNKVRDDNNA